MNQTIAMLRIIEKKTATGYPTHNSFVETHDIYPSPVQAEEPVLKMEKGPAPISLATLFTLCKDCFFAFNILEPLAETGMKNLQRIPAGFYPIREDVTWKSPLALSSVS